MQTVSIAASVMINDSFVAIAIHSIDKVECILKTHLLGCYNFIESHTAVNLSDFMNKCFIEYEILETIKVAVSDNAALQQIL